MMKQTLAHFSLYSLSCSLNAAIGVASVIALTHLLSPESYGRLALFELLVTLLIPVLLLGGQFAMRRDYALLETAKRNRFVRQCFSLPLLAAVVWLPIMVLLSTPLAHVFELPTAWILIAFAAAFLRSLMVLGTSLWQMQKRALTYCLVNSGYRLALLLLAVYVMWAFNTDWYGYVLAMLALLALIAVGTAFTMHKQHRTGKDWKRRGEMTSILRYGLPILPYSYGQYLLLSTDRLLLGNFASVEQAGIYTSALKIASVLLIAFEAARLIWQPWLYPKLERLTASDARHIRRSYGLLLLAGALGACGLYLIAPMLAYQLLPLSYHSAFIYLPWLLLATFFYMAYSLANMVLLFHKDTRIQGLMTLLLALCNLVLSYWMLREIGVLGVAMATALTYTAGLVIMGWLIYRRFGILIWAKP